MASSSASASIATIRAPYVHAVAADEPRIEEAAAELRRSDACIDAVREQGRGVGVGTADPQSLAAPHSRRWRAREPAVEVGIVSAAAAGADDADRPTGALPNREPADAEERRMPEASKGRTERLSWKDALARAELLQLPAAHDALTARLIERAGFTAFQVGGFALVGSRYAHPDVDLEHYGEKLMGVREIVGASALPVLVDADDGYGDVKNVTRTIRGYEAIGASAIFIEDQQAPKRCGHLGGKHVVPVEVMEQKVRAAAAARGNPDTFLLARTDAIEPEGVSAALRRAERYMAAGADGVYVEGPTTTEELIEIGRKFKGVPLATSVLERGGKTPWLAPADFKELGFTMILYPTSVLFRATSAVERALADLIAGRPLSAEDSVDMERFEDIVRLEDWAEVEDEFQQQSLLKRAVRSVLG
jgi:methylisocitrate lyase